MKKIDNVDIDNGWTMLLLMLDDEIWYGGSCHLRIIVMTLQTLKTMFLVSVLI